MEIEKFEQAKIISLADKQIIQQLEIEKAKISDSFLNAKKVNENEEAKLKTELKDIKFKYQNLRDKVDDVARWGRDQDTS